MHDLTDSASLVAVHGHGRAARMVARGLRALAHRGGAAAGIAALDVGVRARREVGAAFLDDEPALEALGGEVAVGQRHGRDRHVDTSLGLIDGVRLPAIAEVGDGPVVVAVSGAFPGATRLRRDLLDQGAALGPATPEELLVQLIAKSRQRRLVNRVVDALWRADGAFAAVIASPDLLVAVRDPRGLRPMVIGHLDGATVVASEESALRAMGALLVRSLAPGEMWIADGRTPVSVRPFPRRAASPCAQESAQLARPDSTVDGLAAAAVRRRLGEELGHVEGLALDVVVPATPDAATAAEGFAAATQLPSLAALVDTSHGPVALDAVVGRQRVALVALSPSEVLRPVVAALLVAGATEVHVRAITPRRVRVCPYGVSGQELAIDQAESAWAARLGASSAAWTSPERFARVLVDQGAAAGVCTACTGGPLPLPLDDGADQLPLFAPEG